MNPVPLILWTLTGCLPAFTEELKQAIEEKRIVLAGCPVYPGAPRFVCTHCGERHE